MLTRFIAVATATLISTAAFAVEVTGAGATFPQPIYMKWAEGYKKASNNTINYQGVGSGAGIKQIEAKTVNFGATDIPVKPEDLEKKGQVQFPMVVGGIVAIVNLKDVEHITLNVDILAKIYMEKIKRWNDAEIAALNPDVKLPDLPIVKIRRADGSGTTWNFTRFLAETNADWKKTYGFGQSVEWAGGAIGAKGNDGVANNVMQTNGSIGYVEYAYAKQNNLTVADMIGKDGKKTSPNLKTFQSTWPMVATTYIILNKENDNKEATQAAIKFFEYGYDNDKDAEALDYVPLTTAQKAESKKAWSQVK
jgi:phosphate transport system substrate-binding protein